MSRKAVATARLLFALAVADFSTLAAADATAPNPDEGVIDGEVAVLGWPRSASDEESYLDPSGYDLHLTAADDLGRESEYPAGVWFKPPKGRYRAWLEGNGRISETVTILSYVGGPFRGKGLVFVDPVAPGGKVALDEAEPAPASRQLRLLHLESQARGEFPRLEMARWLPGSRAHGGALMPEGRVLPSIYDTEEAEYVALGRPVEVRAGGRVEVAPRPPARGTTDLVVVLERPSPLSRHEQAETELILRAGQVARQPAELVRAATRIIAVWYGISSRTATLEVASSRVHLEPVEMRLRPGRVERLSRTLAERPDLAVEIELPEALRTMPATLSVHSRKGDLLTKAEFPASPRRHVFAALPLTEVEVALSIPPWRFLRRVSIADGEDRTVYFAPEAIELEGTVFLGSDEAAAEIAFQIDGTEEMLRVATDEEGAYETVLFKPISALTITLRDRGSPPWLDFLIPPISTSGRRDFILPDNQFEVRVTDSGTGEPVVGALVDIQNSESSGFGFSVTAQADEEGVAALPPLRPGRLSFTASAEGYGPMEEPLEEEIAEDDAGSRLELRLAPEGERRALRLVLSSGLAASGASVCVKRSLADDHSRWCGSADENGTAEVPTSALPGVVIGRHERAGFVVTEIGGLPENGVEIVLPEPAQAPLAVKATDGFGKPVPWADVALFLDDLKLAGSTLGWLTGSPAATNQDGLWLGRNLPAREVSVLASRVDARARAKAGVLDHLREDVPYPWRETVEVFAER